VNFLLAVVGWGVLLVWGITPPDFQEHGVGRAILWGVAPVLRPFAFVATQVDPWFRGFPQWIDVVGTAFLGFLPYALGDLACRRLRAARGSRLGGSASRIG
jgi:hypothetical protein